MKPTFVYFVIACLISTGAANTAFASVFFTRVQGGEQDVAVDITQDQEGFIWFATTRGLLRYDSQSFRRYYHDRSRSGSLPANYLTSILCDSKNRIWIGTHIGLVLYNRELDTFSSFRHRDDLTGIASDTVNCLHEDSRSRLLVGTEHGLSILENSGGQPAFRHIMIDASDPRANIIRAISTGKNGETWLGTAKGVVCMDHNGKITKRFQVHPGSPYPQENDVASIYCDNNNKIWVGTESGDLKCLDPVGGSLQEPPFFSRAGKRKPVVSAILPDGKGKIWITTFDGIVSYDEHTGHATWYGNDSPYPNSLTDPMVVSGFIDRQHGLWLGSYNAGIHYTSVAPDPFTKLLAGNNSKLTSQFADGWYGVGADGNIWGISDNQKQLVVFNDRHEVKASYPIDLPYAMRYNRFYLDREQILWCGGNSIVSRLNLQTKKREDYPFPEKFKKKGRITGFLAAGNGELMVHGPFGSFLFDKETGNFRPGIGARVASASKDSEGNTWFGGKKEVLFLPKNGSGLRSMKINEDDGDVHDVWRVAEDSSGRIWAVTSDMLWLLDRRSNQFRPTPEFADNTVLTDIMCDKDGFLWLSSEPRLIRFHPDRKSIQYFGEADGLPQKSTLRVNAGFLTREGAFFYPTNKGPFFFHPESVSLDTTPTKIVISSLKLFNKKTDLKDNSGIFQKEISRENKLVFRHDQNVFTLDFALLSYPKSHQNRFAYKLSGFEKNWNYVDNPSATYTNLSPGTYTFMVKAANGDGYWMPEPLKVRVEVLPPWWNTWYAYVVYALLAAGAIYALNRFLWLKRTARQENELYQAKLDFFTNISHEIRTHLTLISGPVGKAFELTTEGSAIRNFLVYARNNSDRLMVLVNELLDFRKIQGNKIKLFVSEHNIVAVLRNVMASFEHVAAEKEITARLETSSPVVSAWFDISQIQKVLYNLLGNAFKFTQEGGQVVVTVQEEAEEIKITVQDNGQGIAPEHIGHLFTNFYQVYENTSGNTGYGIGLALSKEIAGQHQGKLEVTSRQKTSSHDGETCFQLTLRKGKTHFLESDLTEPTIAHHTSANLMEYSSIKPENDPINDPQKHTLLIIDDNDELRAFGIEALRDSYRTLEAENGKKGLELAREHMPDMIVCDVMMPEMNGLEVCKSLRSDFHTRHIPIILVSARSTTQQMMEGFQAGADAYLIKPFDFRVLELQVNNLISIRERLKEKNSQSISYEPDEPVVNDPDEAFLLSLKKLVLRHISEADFGVNEMAFETGISVSVLYRKLRALTGMTVNEFTKKIRMKRAMQLLESGVYNVNEVANMVGFEDSKYFSKEFRKTFDQKPSDIRKKTPSDEENDRQV
ncbi:two-component regulator propeller domain-containing protein [Ravibacter arvi]|uniref:histidine kinase n=1 Tax=Ravibacter arvi TaxID=2051041 RepID=A0ABP8MFD9_9BACT